MNKYSEQEIEFSLLQEKPINIVGILMRYLVHWKWFLISIISCCLIALIYIIYATPTYKVETSILFKDDMRGGTSELNVLKEMGLVTRRSNADNEIEVLKKSLIVEEVVRELNIYTTYSEKKDIKLYKNIGISKILPNILSKKTQYLYIDESPFTVVIVDSVLNSIVKPIKIEASYKANGDIHFSGSLDGSFFNTKLYRADSVAFFPFGKANIHRNNKTDNKNSRVINLTIYNPLNVTSEFQKAMKIELTSKTSSVANISIECLNGNLGKDFLDLYITTYNQKGINEQIELADKTSKVIESHLSQLSDELNSVENIAQNYKQSKGLTNISSQADIYNSQSANVRQRQMDVESQLSIVSSLNSFVHNLTDPTALIPSNSGITSPSLIAQIDDYNKLVLERNRLSRIASSNNQSIIDLNNRINSTLSSVRSGLQNEKNNLDIQQNDISSMLSQNYARLRAIPQQEREYSDILRQQNVKEALFVYLLQKKEEKYMNMASVMPNSKLIDNIYIKGISSPNVKIIMLIFLSLGFFIPLITIFVMGMLQYKITSKENLEELSSIPILGEIPKASFTNPIVVDEAGNDSFNEMMRLLRANLLFVMNGSRNKVINMISSVSNEGKTFLTINLAKSLALLDKNVLIIELDIRKPKLSKTLNIKNNEGISKYLSGIIGKEELIKPSNIHNNVLIITCGIIPPNPNELLSKPLLDELINDLKNQFDYIIIDTAPISVVSDSFLLNRISDVNLYVVKSDFTHKKLIEEADIYHKENRLNKMYFILNNIDLNKKTYEYGYRRQYGYGHNID